MVRVNGSKKCADKNGFIIKKMRYYIIFAAVFGGSFLIQSINNISEIIFINNDASADFFQYNVLTHFSESYTIKTGGCTIPALKPLGEEVKIFVQYPDGVRPCPNSNPSLLASNRTHIWVRSENKEHYRIYNNKDFVCCYRTFESPHWNDKIFYVDNRANYSNCNEFTNIKKVAHEFVKVECNFQNNTVYEQYFLFAPLKISQTISNADKASADKTPYNVIVMGIDAVSRLNFHRTMPNTLAFLRKNDAIELLGYNKVGDNTFPNIVPMLMGLSEEDLNICIPNKTSGFDNCPFIWKLFRQAGYYTAFGEDSYSLGTFNYLQNGFLESPTDYYIHTFIQEAESNAGLNKVFSSKLCMNEKYFYTVLLDYIKDITLTLSTKKLFGFFWEITMSHDNLNYPMVMDRDYVNFFRSLQSSNYLNKTIFILVSDHGMRWGKIRLTNQGRLEERLPFVYILTPTTFRNKYSQAYKNLKLNRRRLTTPYDVHATLFDLINLEHIENRMIEIRSKQSYATFNRKGTSLFLPIPTNRTCAMAHIDDHWCACHKGKKLSPKSIQAENTAERLLKELNSLLRDYSQCAQLKLTEVIDFTEMVVDSPEYDNIAWKEYMIVIRTEPGNAVFEGTLRNISHSWSLAGTVSRLNLYGNQSRCVHHYLLKLYCYCTI